MPEGFFTEGNEENEDQIFSLKTISWLPSFPSVGPNPEGALDGPKHPGVAELRPP
jgi:hypothetical protein